MRTGASASQVKVHHGEAQSGAVSFLASEDARLLDRRLRRIEQLLELLPLLLAMGGVDPTHVPIEVAALALGVSVPTIRRRIRRGELPPLEVIAGTKVSGVPIEAIYSLWIPIRVARAALARERDEIARRAATGARSTNNMRG
jgi:hypothetical protein